MAKILEGQTIYEKGTAVGRLELQEGQRSERMVIIESFPGSWCDLKEVSLTEAEQKTASRLSEAVEGKPKVLMTLEGRFHMADAVNGNNRIYPDSIWKNVLGTDSKWLKRIENGQMLGEADHPKDGETLLRRVACMVTGLHRNEDNPKEIMGRLVIFDTQGGRDLKAIHEGGGKLGVSSRGPGSLVRMDGNDVVQDDYDLETWDVVHNPSVTGAYPTEVQENRKTPGAVVTESIGNQDNMDLSILTARLAKNKARVAPGISKDAGRIIKEELEEIRKSLTEGQWGKDTMKATAALSETTAAAKSLDELLSVPTPAQRPTTRDGVVSLIESLLVVPSNSIEETAKTVRERYRSAALIDGPLKKHELEGIAAASRKLMTEAKSPPAKDATYFATIKLGEKEVVLQNKSEARLRKSIAEVVGKERAVIVELDHSGVIYEECAERFSPLLEAQVVKTTKAIDEASRARAELSQMSAKLSAAREIIEGFVARLGKVEKALVESKSDFDVAEKLFERLVNAAPARSKEAVCEALAIAFPSLSESLRKTSDISSAVKLAIASRPQAEFNREPVVAAKIVEALRADIGFRAEKAAPLPTKSKSRTVDPVMSASVERTNQLVEEMQRRKSGK